MKNANGANTLSSVVRSIIVVPSVKKGGKNTGNASNDNESGTSRPPHAVHPISGGIPPTTDPTHVFHTLRLFIHVYTPAYSTIFASPKHAVVGFVIVHNSAGPATPVTTANPSACSGVTARLTSGRILVRAICASNGTSCSWFSVFADAEHSTVPSAVESRIGRVVGNGESATPDIEVRTTRMVRFDFASWL